MKRFISMSEYQKRYKMGAKTVKQKIYNGELKATKTEGGHYKIEVFDEGEDQDYVPRKMYEDELKRRIELETLLNSAITLLSNKR